VPEPNEVAVTIAFETGVLEKDSELISSARPPDRTGQRPPV